ncbi:MAG TPA: APC family permease [Candidatus Dormibacteraeota bacterium]
MKERRGRRPGDVRVVMTRGAKLPRTLGTGALFAACYGNVGSSIYYALGVTAAIALGLTPLAFLLAGCIFVTTALNYAEGTAAVPQAGGSSSFARRAFNEPTGFLVGWIQLLNYTATVAISAYTGIAYLTVFPIFHVLTDASLHGIATVVLIALLMAINVVGIQESSALNLGLAVLDLGTQIVLVVLGIFLLLNIQVVLNNIHWGIAPTWGNFLASVSIAMVSYTGIETISNMSEEAKNPGRTVPRATFFVIGAVLFVSAFLPTIGMSVFPVHYDAVHGLYFTELGTKWAQDPVAGIVTAFRPEWLAFWAGVWVAILAFTILVIATNAGLIGISRLSYSLGTNKLIPKQFATLHPRFKTPYISIIVFGIAAAILVLPGKLTLLAATYSLAATFAFCVAHLAVMRLRYVSPELYRPYQMPINIPFGRASIPVLSVVGALAIGAVFTQLAAQNIEFSTYIFAGWVVLGVAAFVAYRRYTRQFLWEPLAVPPPPDREIQHQPLVIPHSARVRLKHPERIRDEPIPEPEVAEHERHLRRRRFQLLLERAGRLRVILGLLVCVAVSVLAIWVDLSPYDPFGPGIGWSPGILVVTFASAFLLIRSRYEE